MSDTDNRTATQRISDLESVVTMLYQSTAQIKNAVEGLLRTQGDMVLVKDALKLLNKKLEAVVQVAAPETGITASSVTDLVVKMNVSDLKAQVEGYVANGHLVPADTAGANSYLVCEELNQDGTLANPRIQFRLDSQEPATAEALIGKKVGDAVSFGENKFSAKILEIYSVVEPKSEAAAETTSAPATDAAPTTQETPDVAAAPATETAPATSAAATPAAPTLDQLPPENTSTFGLQFHGQPDPNMVTANS